MTEQELRGLIVAFKRRAAMHREAARTTTLDEARFANRGWASGYEAAAAELADLLGDPAEETRAKRIIVRHLSEKETQR